jgi:hypothetical protein
MSFAGSDTFRVRFSKQRLKQRFIENSGPNPCVATITTVYKAYIAGLPARYLPTERGKRYILATLGASLAELNNEVVTKQPTSVEYDCLCPGWSEDYGCLGGAFLSLCWGSALTELCEQIPMVVDLLIHAAKRMGIKTRILQEPMKPGVCLFGVICGNLPCLAVKLLQEPKESTAYPSALQIGSMHSNRGGSLFWNVVQNGSIDLLRAMTKELTLHEMIDRIEWWYWFITRNTENELFLKDKLVTLLRADAAHIESVTKIHAECVRTLEGASAGEAASFARAIQEIRRTHSLYIRNLTDTLPNTLTSVGLLPCFSPLLRSFLF